MENEELRIIIGGDTVPSGSNEAYLMNGQDKLVFNGIKDVFSLADIVIVNLECPLTYHDVSINKAGPCLKANPKSINGLQNAGINIFSLANNHIMDFGATGLRDTITVINEKRALYVGVGDNLNEARKILYVEKKDYKIAFISVAEHEFSIAREDYPGANPFDPYDTLDDIKQASQEADLTIVLYHGGIEHYQYPSPSLHKDCHRMAEQGADVIICQHSHCVGAYENYRGAHIVYGQGNLLFDYSNHVMWREGLLVQITVDKKERRIRFIPVTKDGFVIDLADNIDQRAILDQFEVRSKRLFEKDFIKNEWIAFCTTRRNFYLHSFMAFGFFVRRLDRKLHYILTNVILNKEKLVLMYNLINCEAHIDVFKTYLEETYYKENER